MSRHPHLVRLITACTVSVSASACSLPQGSDPNLYAALGDADLRTAARTVQQTLESAPDGVTRSWADPASSSSGTVRPVTTYVRDDGRFCRQYEEELRVGGGQGSYLHAACRDSEGSWVWQ